MQTLSVFTEPEVRIARTFCKLGRNRRRVMPVVFLPIPPDFFERPRRAIEFPTIGFFPQISHVFTVLFLPLRLAQPANSLSIIHIVFRLLC